VYECPSAFVVTVRLDKVIINSPTKQTTKLTQPFEYLMKISNEYFEYLHNLIVYDINWVFKI